MQAYENMKDFLRLLQKAGYVKV